MIQSDVDETDQFLTKNDLPLYWAVIDELFHLVKDDGNVSYFAHLYMSILMDIQHYTGLAVDPIYFEVLLSWYYENFAKFTEHDRLYAQRLLKQYQSGLDLEISPYRDFLDGNSIESGRLEQSVNRQRDLILAILQEGR